MAESDHLIVYPRSSCNHQQLEFFLCRLGGLDHPSVLDSSQLHGEGYYLFVFKLSLGRLDVIHSLCSFIYYPNYDQFYTLCLERLDVVFHCLRTILNHPNYDELYTLRLE